MQLPWRGVWRDLHKSGPFGAEVNRNESHMPTGTLGLFGDGQEILYGHFNHLFEFLRGSKGVRFSP